jgi:PcaR/PcaU/PobR family beta-ketoadipate pathway transcriptional regulator
LKRQSGKRTAGPAINHPFYIASIEKAFRLLTAFDQKLPEMSLSQLAEATSLTIPNVQRITHTLVELGLLTKDEPRKKYALTPRALDIGYRYLQASPIVERAAPYLANLANRSQETVSLTVLDGTEAVYVARHRGLQTIPVNLFIGARLPAFATGVGQVLMAFLPPAEAARILERSIWKKFTRHTLSDAAAVLRKLERIRKNGYAIEDQEMFLGGMSVAAPVFGRDGRPVAAVNVGIPTSRFTMAEADRRFAKMVVETGRAIFEPAY